YGIDVKVPGMLYASVLRSPVFGGKVKSFDATKAKAVPGVKDVVRIDAIGTDLPWNGVAVVATSTWAAMRGREALSVAWDEGEHAGESTESLRKQFAEIVDRGTAVVTRGDVAAALAGAAKKLDAVYELPYLAHAAMEPLNATAHVKADGAELWLATQFADWAANASAKFLGMQPEQIKVHVTMLGGGFGRRANPDFALEAVQISKAVGAPVKVQWTREDDMTHDYYRPASHHRISAGIDAGGNVVAWHHRIAAPSIISYMEPEQKERVHESETPGVRDMPYEIAHFRTDFALAKSGVPRGWWRSVEHSINGFVVNSFLDELAHAGGRDPIELRLALLPKGFVQKAEGERNPARLWPFKSDRLRAVIELAREKSGWGKPLPAGRALGFAAHHSFFSYAAQVAEVSMEGDTPRVHRIVCAIDCGVPVNPDGIRAQIEGGIVYGLAAALGEQITIENGRVQQSNFHDFPLLTIDRMPMIEVHIVPSSEPPTGTGEPGLPPAAAAVTNAMFKLTGNRIRTLPIAT
ncbi:MAG TPA: molybdopterin cofactor-binding domain-containing protein, partial [Thermoanaerobaculia bacterium]|nr:molybdopterin cofactor-binding domain-containing protein [Thermoanaerobaculia bacterium]